ncbi:MAG: PilZN3 domain-containing protein, partial [Spirochaetota bacterium]
MSTSGSHDIYAQFENEAITVNPFATTKLGIVPGQTMVKVASYNIVCAPYRISMKSALLMASFSREELVFFQRYANGLAGLAMVFQQASSQQPFKIFARCVLKSITSMKSREAIGIISVVFKPCPPDLVAFLGDYLMLLERLKVEYDDFKGKRIGMNPESAKLMGYNNFAELSCAGGKSKMALFGLASDRLEFLLPVQAPELAGGMPATIKLYFQSYQFLINAKIHEVMKLPSSAQKASAYIDFSP